MTREEKQKAIDALKISAPVMAVTQEEFENYIQTLNKIMDWLEQEPTGSNNLSSGTRKNSKKLEKSTTKNDLAVDCISRDSAIKALDYAIESFEFKSGVSKYMDDIAKLLDTIYKIQVNNIKALPSVTPQEPRKGHWIVQPSNEEQGERPFIWWKCSKCGQVIFSETEHDRLEFHAFCGRCGADMSEV